MALFKALSAHTGTRGAATATKETLTCWTMAAKNRVHVYVSCHAVSLAGEGSYAKKRHSRGS